MAKPLEIAFVPNDPRASAFNTPRRQPPRKDRPRGRARFDFGALPAAKPYPRTSDGALAWQSREAALAAVEMFEELHGPLTQWARSTRKRTLEFSRDGGLDLNAYYDGDGVRFFHYPVAGNTLFSGASTEVVAHEVGHALLDAIRPALWDSSFPEVAAFHEAFGDCIAILTALADADIRRHMVKRVGRRNYVETFGEELAWAIRKMVGAGHNAAKPRRAHNTFKWALPATLAENGAAGALINEPHSFGQVFSGCFYDAIGLAFADGTKNEAALWSAAAGVAQALFAAAKSASIMPRFFQSIGRAMALHDRSNAGTLRGSVEEAFAKHGIGLGSSAAGVPHATIAGDRLRRRAAASPALMPETAADLRSRLGVAAGTTLSVRSVALGRQRLVEASHRRRVDLSGLAPYLDGVTAAGSEPVLVAPVRGTMAIMSSVPDSSATVDEVHAFVRGLVARREILHARNRTAANRGAVAQPSLPPVFTHRVVRQRSGAVLQRVRFACRCC